MKKLFTAALAVGGIFAVQQAQAACIYPLAPGKFPDGSVATRDQIESAKGMVVKYDADMNAYLVCIRNEHDKKLATQSDATAEQKAEMERVHTQKENAALAEVQDVVARFNKQLEVWNGRNPTEKTSS